MRWPLRARRCVNQPKPLMRNVKQMPKHLIVKHSIVFFGLCSLSFASTASESENQAKSFANIYASLCLKHMANLEGLRTKLEQMPKLPPEKANLFLAGSAGDAWSVPDKHGTFVLALPFQKNVCAVFAQRADAASTEKLFIQSVASAPSPLAAKKTADQQAHSAANGPVHKLAYEWTAPKAVRKMHFMLTTATSHTAQIQAMATASVLQGAAGKQAP